MKVQEICISAENCGQVHNNALDFVFGKLLDEGYSHGNWNRNTLFNKGSEYLIEYFSNLGITNASQIINNFDANQIRGLINSMQSSSGRFPQEPSLLYNAIKAIAKETRLDTKNHDIYINSIVSNTLPQLSSASEREALIGTASIAIHSQRYWSNKSGMFRIISNTGGDLEPLYSVNWELVKAWDTVGFWFGFAIAPPFMGIYTAITLGSLCSYLSYCDQVNADPFGGLGNWLP